MTLRFFRRKPSDPESPPEDSKTESQPAAEREAPASASTASGSSRRSTRPSSRSGSTSRTSRPAKNGASKSASSSSRTTSSRSSRGRRGGASRKSAAKPAEKPAAATEEACITPLRAESATLIDVFAQQQALLEQLTERQLTALKGLQGSLSAIENRLGDVDRQAPPSAATARERVGIFVDVPNVVYAAERLGVKIDFGKMRSFLVRGRELARASAYAPISDDPMARLETQRFVQPFVGLGYRIVTKPLKRYADGSMKANFDVELAIDVLSMSDRLDTVSLVSGDGDFRRLVELVASKGVRVEVVAFGQSMAAELRAVADEYYDINDHLAELRAN